MLFHRKGILPAPMKRTTRKPASFNSCERVLRDQNLMCPLSQKGIEMCVPLFGERKNKILRVAVIRRADDKVTAGPEELLRETRQATRSSEMLDYLRSDSHIKALVTNHGRIVVHP